MIIPSGLLHFKTTSAITCPREWQEAKYSREGRQVYKKYLKHTASTRVVQRKGSAQHCIDYSVRGQQWQAYEERFIQM